jgi:ABC-2 type transport system ATP-binding protein
LELSSRAGRGPPRGALNANKTCAQYPSALAKKGLRANIAAMSAALPVIDVHHLRKQFGAVTAIDDISFSISGGSITALLGANGAGKTTTIAVLLGLLLPTSGSVTVLGEDMLRHRYRVLGRMNFSSPYFDLPQRLTVAQNLSVYARLYNVRDIEGRLEVLADDLDLVDLLTRPFRALSAGQKTRVLLAKALVNQPELLLLDEPTASLDPNSADWIRGYLERYRERTGSAIVMASHNMAEVERLCDTVLMMQQGRIIDHGSPDDLIKKHGRETLEEVFLDIARGRSQAAGAEAAA